MSRNILTVLLIGILTVSLFATPTNNLNKHEKGEILEVNEKVYRSKSSQKHVSSENKGKNNLVKHDYTEDEIVEKESDKSGSKGFAVGHILKNDDSDGDELDSRITLNIEEPDMFADFLIYVNHFTEALNYIGHSLADGAHVAAGKISDISHKTHDAYLVSKDQFLRTEEKVANKAHDIFLYTQEEFEYVVEEMRKEANRHALYIGLFSGICSYFLMFPITFLLKVLYKKCFCGKNRYLFFTRCSSGENKPLLKKEKGVGAIDFDL